MSSSENVEATASHVDSVQQGFVGARSSARPEARVSRLSLSGDGGRSTDFGSDCVPLSTIADYAPVEVDGLLVQGFRDETIEDAIGVERLRGFNPYPHPPIVHWLIVDEVTTVTDAGESIKVIGYDAGGTPTVSLSVGANQLGFGLETYTWCQPLERSPDPELVFASTSDLDAIGLDRSMRCRNLIVTDYFSIELEDGSRVSDYRAQSIIEALGVLRRTQPEETSRVAVWLVLDDEQFQAGSELQTRVLGFDSETQLLLDIVVSRNQVGYGVTLQGVC